MVSPACLRCCLSPAGLRCRCRHLSSVVAVICHLLLPSSVICPSPPCHCLGKMSDIPNAAAVRPACQCCHPSVITVTCQPATHTVPTIRPLLSFACRITVTRQPATHAARRPRPPSNMWDIPNTAAACPAPKIKSKICR